MSPGAAKIDALLKPNATDARTGRPTRVAAGATPPTSFPALPRERPKPILMMMPGYAAAPIGAIPGPATAVSLGTRVTPRVTMTLLKTVEAPATRAFLKANQQYPALRMSAQAAGWANRVNVDSILKGLSAPPARTYFDHPSYWRR